MCYIYFTQFNSTGAERSSPRAVADAYRPKIVVKTPDDPMVPSGGHSPKFAMDTQQLAEL